MTRVRVERDGKIGRVTLARPEKKNALDRQAATELRDALRVFGEDDSVGVIVLGADGADFCAGADLAALEATLEAGSEAHLSDARALGAVFVAMRELPKPVVAIVRGRALAGGAGLATAADIVLAHENARFGYPEVRVGFVPAMVMTMLRRAVGEKRAFELVATGRIVDAAEALELGLVSRVIVDRGFDRAVAAYLAELAAAPPNALRLTKRLFYGLEGRDFSSAIEHGAQVNAEARDTDEFRDGVRRFTARGATGR